MVVAHPDLVRTLVLTGTDPRGGKDMDKVVGVTYWDILVALLNRSDPKEFLLFNRDAEGKRAGKALVKRLEEHRGPRREDQHEGLQPPAQGDPALRTLEPSGSPGRNWSATRTPGTEAFPALADIRPSPRSSLTTEPNFERTRKGSRCDLHAMSLRWREMSTNQALRAGIGPWNP